MAMTLGWSELRNRGLAASLTSLAEPYLDPSQTLDAHEGTADESYP